MARINRAKQRRALLYGLVLFALLYTIAAWVAVPRIESDLSTRSQKALSDAGFDVASVSADGRRVTVEGARSEADREQLAAVVRAVRGVWRVRVPPGEGAAFDPSLAPEVVALELTLEANTLTVRGQVPSRELKDSLAAAATATFGQPGGAQVLDDVVVRETATPAEGAAADVAALNSALAPLAKLLLSGLVTLSDRELEVAGLPRGEASRADFDTVLATAATQSPGLQVVNSVKERAGSAKASTATSTPTSAATTAAAPSAAFTVELATGKLTLVGTTVSGAQRQALADAANAAIGAANVAVNLSPGAASTDDAARTAALVEVVGLAKADLVAAKVTVNGNTLNLDAFVPSAAAKATVEAVLARARSAGYTVDSRIEGPAPPGGKDSQTTSIETQLNELVRLQSIPFASASADLATTAAPTLDAAAALLRGLSGFVVTVEGHTDNTGDPVLNQTLSQRRADAVRAALVARGVPEALLTAVGYGDSKPRADNATEAGRQDNRRVQFDVRRA